MTKHATEADASQTKKTTQSSSFNDAISDMKGLLKLVDNWLSNLFLKKFPPMPKNVKESFVKYFPILNLIGMILMGLGIAIILQGLVFSSWLSVAYSTPYLRGFGAVILFGMILAMVKSVAQLYFMYKAQQGLNTQKKYAWNNLWYASLIGLGYEIVSSLTWALNIVNLFLGVLFSGLFLYVLYQIRSYYTK